MKYRMFLGFSSLSLGLLAGCGSDSTSTATEEPVVESASNPCIYDGYTGYYAADNETLICVDPTGAIAFWISPDGTFGYPNTETLDGTDSTVATSSNSASPESSPSNPAQGSTTEPVPGSSSVAIPGTAESSSSGEAVTEACPGNPTAAYSIAGVNYYFDGQKYYYLDAECNRIYIEPATSSSSQAVVVSSSSRTRSSSSQGATSSTTAPGASSSSQASGSSTIGGGDTDDNENDDTDSRTLDGTETLITVNGTSASIENDNGCLTLGDKNVTVTCSGSYYFTGKGSDFQILVNVANAADLENVGIYFYNLDLTSSSAPVIVVSAEKTVFHIVKGTTNTLTNGTTLTTFTKKDGSSDDADAVIVAKDDINFKGAGSLTINGKLTDGSGIKCSNDIKIKNGNITVTASNNGIKGKGSVQISGGTLNVTSTAGDGIKSDEGEDEGTVVADKGIVSITGGTVTVKAADEGIQAYNSVIISDSSDAAKVTVTTSTGDGIHSNLNIYMNGGNVEISAGDDGIHADSTLYLRGSTINVTKATEGMEGYYIRAEGGITATYGTDDGWNAAGGSADGSTSTGGNQGGWGMGGGMQSSSKGYIVISGGYHYISASGNDIDVLDANGTAKQTGGVLLLEIPSSSGGQQFGGGFSGGSSSGCSTNGAGGLIDTDSGYEITGGVMLAFGNQTEEYPNCTAISYTAGTYYGTSNAAFAPKSSGSKILYGGEIKSVTQVNVSGMTEVSFPNGLKYYYK